MSLKKFKLLNKDLKDSAVSYACVKIQMQEEQLNAEKRKERTIFRTQQFLSCHFVFLVFIFCALIC